VSKAAESMVGGSWLRFSVLDGNCESWDLRAVQSPVKPASSGKSLVKCPAVVQGLLSEVQSVLPTRDPRQRPGYELCFALRNGSVEKAQTYQVGRAQ